MRKRLDWAAIRNILPSGLPDSDISFLFVGDPPNLQHGNISTNMRNHVKATNIANIVTERDHIPSQYTFFVVFLRMRRASQSSGFYSKLESILEVISFFINKSYTVT